MTFERTYTIPLRQGTIKAPRTRRAKKAILVLREFVAKHSKSDAIVIGQELNDLIWSQGMRNPPMKVVVTVKKEKDGKVYVNLTGNPVKSA